MIDMRPIKLEISKKFPNSTLNKVLQGEPDTLSENEFFAKSPIWDRLANEGL
jgi:hypothetical protein